MDLFIAKKWNKLLRRARLFSFVPFVELVFVAGSMAMGNADEDSDFDFIIGVKTGRIFTARSFCYLFFGILGWRRKRGERGVSLSDKFCLNHFVTPEKYKLSGPYSESWQKLYSSLVPIYGNKDMIQKFYDANAGWTGSVRHCEEPATKPRLAGPRLPQSLAMTEKGRIKSILEKMSSGKLGDVLEKLLKKIQIKKIEKSLRTEKLHNPRIIFNDSELEFHPDRKKFEL